MGDGRNGVNFQDFPASFLSAVEVIKSPTPDMVEGALGGTISLKTARPLDLKDRLIAVSVDAEYADKAEKWAPVVSVAGGENWDFGDAGSFGLMGMMSYQDRTLRQDTFQVSQFIYDGAALGLGDAQNTPSGDYIVPGEHKFEPFIEERERTAYNVSMQWAPASEAGSFFVDWNATERTGGQEAYSILHAGETPLATADSYEDSNGALNHYRFDNALIIPKTWSEFRQTDSSSVAFGGDWNFTEQFNVSAEFSTAKSSTYLPSSEFNWRALDPEAEALDPSASNEYRPSGTVIMGDNQAASVIYDGGNPYLMTENLALREFRHEAQYIDNEEEAFRVDFEYFNPGDLLWLTSVKAGYRAADNEYSTREYQLRQANLHSEVTDAMGNPIVFWQDDIAALFPGTIITPGVSGDAFEHSGMVGPSHLTSFSVYDGKLLQNADASFAMVQQLLAGTSHATTGSLSDNLNELKSAYANITEASNAFYAQANMDFDHVRFVIGARLVETKITSTAYNQAGNALVSDSNKYQDLLPSFNATVDLTDDTLMRFAAAKVMARPDFEQLSPTFNFNGDYILATRGNPDLDPYRATQFDIAFEHYFGTGDMVSATLFYKSVASFLKSETFCAYEPEALAIQNKTIPGNICIRPEATGDSSTYIFTNDQAEFDSYDAAGRRGILTSTTANGSSGTIQGFEIGYQQGFEFLPGPWSGLGINANYTLSQSEDPDGTPLPDISENSYNMQLYWEYEGIGIRLAYTYRDGFLDENNEKRVERVGELVAYNTPEIVDPTTGTDYRDELQQWDLSANWDINETYSVVANVSNLTAEPTVNRGATGTIWEVQESDRRFVFGVRGKF
jgi:TonB-dependent receptor